jgi:hypothetical protein
MATPSACPACWPANRHAPASETFISAIIQALAAGRLFVCPTSPDATTWAASLPEVLDTLIPAVLIDVGTAFEWLRHVCMQNTSPLLF